MLFLLSPHPHLPLDSRGDLATLAVVWLVWLVWLSLAVALGGRDWQLRVRPCLGRASHRLGPSIDRPCQRRKEPWCLLCSECSVLLAQAGQEPGGGPPTPY